MNKLILIMVIVVSLAGVSLSACGKGKMVEDITIEEGK